MTDRFNVALPYTDLSNSDTQRILRKALEGGANPPDPDILSFNYNSCFPDRSSAPIVIFPA